MHLYNRTPSPHAKLIVPQVFGKDVQSRAPHVFNRIDDAKFSHSILVNNTPSKTQSPQPQIRHVASNGLPSRSLKQKKDQSYSFKCPNNNKDANFLTLGQVNISEQPPTISSYSSQDLKHNLQYHPFQYSLQQDEDDDNNKGKLKDIVNNVFRKKPEQEAQSMQIDLITCGKKDTMESPRPLLKNKFDDKVFYVKQKQVQVSSDQETGSLALHSFNPQQFQQIVKKSAEEKGVQTSMRKLDELDMLPEPERLIPSMQSPDQKVRMGVLKKTQSQSKNVSMKKCVDTMQLIEQVETEKVKLQVFMADNSEDQLIFAGIAKQKINKQGLLKNLQQLFINASEKQDEDSSRTQKSTKNQYISMHELEHEVQNSQKFSKCDSFSIAPLINEFPSCSSSQSKISKIIDQEKYGSSDDLKIILSNLQRPQTVQQIIQQAKPKKNTVKRMQFGKSDLKIKAKPTTSPFLKKSANVSPLKLREISQSKLNIQTQRVIKTEKKAKEPSRFEANGVFDEKKFKF